MTRTAASREPSARPRQSTDTVLMIRPRHFFSNPETALSNEFQRDDARPELARVQQEFDGLREALTAAGVRVLAFDDRDTPVTPDAVFPNNWLSTHADGTLIRYPMQPPSRRLERRDDIVAALSANYGFAVRRELDLSVHEGEGRFLEGTGSLVLDRVNRRAYACLSPRTHPDTVAAFCAALDYTPVTFDAHGQSGQAVYHTNVMMCVGTRVIVACVAAIAPADRERVVAAMTADHELIELTMAQMNAFAGNMLELRGEDGTPLMAMSARAAAALTPAQTDALSRHVRIVSAPIPSIEDAAGGSVRCMLAEIFLPKEHTA